ncbi:membrane protein [Microbacterium phage Pumpernickel]|uniref:Membrane protein n=1 Tax=Microbacterium phage Pumpernickel TaxID=2885983 RepID=A0AAE9C2Y5_9CAUD|nr:membrane protein [Microbacterium phage Pumpernickel]UDL15992.1 membrane protein [Microbacterium phage Pumpernickel]
MSIPAPPPPASKPWYKRPITWIIAGSVAFLLFLVLMFSLTAALLSSGRPEPAPAPTVTVTQEPAPAPEPKPEPSEDPAPPPAAPEASSDEQAYLDFLRQEAYFKNIDDGTLLTAGYAICDAIGAGETIDGLFYTADQNGIPGYEAGYLIGSAVAGLCPEYTSVVEDYLAQNGS